MSNQMNGFTDEELQMMEEMESLIAEMKQHPEIANAKVPESLHKELFRDIREYEAEKAKSIPKQPEVPELEVSRLTEEEQELIRLGKKYKKSKKNKKFYVLIAAAVLAMGFGVTSMGGPERVMERFARLVPGRDQTRVNSSGDNIELVEGISEEEIFQQIEDEYGFVPVRMTYMPEEISFIEAVDYDDMQGIQLIYGKEDKVGLVYLIRPNYRDSSVGKDMEDKLLGEYVLEIKNLPINIKHYIYKDANEERWSAEFVYMDIQYFITGADCSQGEFEEILKNLYFL